MSVHPQSRRQLRSAESPAPGDENSAARGPESLPGCSRAPECPGHVLSGVDQWNPQRRAGSPAMGGLECR